MTFQISLLWRHPKQPCQVASKSTTLPSITHLTLKRAKTIFRISLAIGKCSSRWSTLSSPLLQWTPAHEDNVALPQIICCMYFSQWGSPKKECCPCWDFRPCLVWRMEMWGGLKSESIEKDFIFPPCIFGWEDGKVERWKTNIKFFCLIEKKNERMEAWYWKSLWPCKLGGLILFVGPDGFWVEMEGVD